MRKLVSALAVTAGLTLLAGPAHAQDGRGYPRSRGGLTVSESTVSPGESFTVSGGGAEPGATIAFTLQRSSSALRAGRAVAAGPRSSCQHAGSRPSRRSPSAARPTPVAGSRPG
jgi:hypothetical protein